MVRRENNGKPKDRNEAFERLKALSGKSHEFFTGIHMINTENGRTISRLVETHAKIRELTEQEINKYLNEDQNFNTYALGYDPIKHYSSSFVKELTGSYYNLLGGLPLETIVEMLAEVGYD